MPTMPGFDHGDERGEALLGALGDEARASPDAADSVGDNVVVRVVCVVLRMMKGQNVVCGNRGEEHAR